MTCRVISVLKSLLCLLFHLLVIHNFLHVKKNYSPYTRSRLQENDRKQTLNYDEKSLQLKPRKDTIYQTCKSNLGEVRVEWLLVQLFDWWKMSHLLEGKESVLGVRWRKREAGLWSVDLWQCCQKFVSDKLSLKWNYLLDGKEGEFVRLCRCILSWSFNFRTVAVLVVCFGFFVCLFHKKIYGCVFFSFFFIEKKHMWAYLDMCY